MEHDKINNDFHYYYSAAFDSILSDFKWIFPADILPQLKQAIVKHSNDSRLAKQAVFELLVETGFYWPEFDACVRYGVETGKTGWFYEFTQFYPRKPENLLDLLDMMKFYNLRELAKNLGLTRLSRRKIDLIEQIFQMTTFESLSALAESEYEKAIIDYSQREIIYKCEALVLAVSVREAALRNLKAYADYQQEDYNWSRKEVALLLDFDEHPESADLAKLIIPGGYDSISVKHMERLPPFFPADRSWLRCKLVNK